MACGPSSWNDWNVNWESSSDFQWQDPPCELDDITLFIHGSDSISDDIDLFIKNEVDSLSDNIPLYILSVGEETSNIPLYLLSMGEESYQTTLYIQGHEEISSQMNLFTSGAEPESISDNIDLTIFGATTPTTYSGLYLSILGESEKEANLNLFIQSRDSGELSTTFNLFLHSDIPQESVPLYVNGAGAVEISNELPLAMLGSPIGYLDGEMNLFLERPTSDCIFMVIYGPPNSESSSATMYIKGAEVINGDLMLSLPNVVSDEQDSLDLYTHGF